MVIDKAPGATAVFLVMIASVGADVIVISLFPNITTMQMTALIVVEVFSLVSLMLAGRYYYVARDERDHFVAAEHIAAMLPEEERQLLLERSKQTTFPPRVRTHIEALLKTA